MPKANLVYETDNAGSAKQLVNDSNKATATVTFNGASPFVVDDATVILEVGADYEPDTWAFTFV